MGVGNSVYQRVLKGKVAMTVDSLLQIADALDLDWPELFRRAYLASSQSSPEPATLPDEFEQKVLEILRRHGVLPDPASPERIEATGHRAPAQSAARAAREAAPGTSERARSSPH